MGTKFDRRDALKAGLAAITGPMAMGWASPPAREVRAFRLIEAAGLRRFGYPVHAIVPDASDGRNFRLLRDGRAIPAQFREVKEPGGLVQVHLDFIASPGPLEVGQYQVIFGREVEPGPEPKDGLKLGELDGRYRVTLGGTTTFEIDHSPAEFLRAVGSPRLAYLGEVASGLRIRTKGELKSPNSPEFGKPKLEVTRHGPMAVGFRSVQIGTDTSAIGLELTVPSSKSWIQVVANVADPGGIVEGLQLDLNLKIEGSPALIDLGASSTVYGQIQGEERMELVSGRAIGEPDPAAETRWIVRKGQGANPPILATSADHSLQSAEGWAHVMDARRCSALGLANFGKAGARDLFSVGADGRTQMIREYALAGAEPPRGTKSMAFWLHFVPMPVQVGAATSPQSMMAPLLVEWDRPPNSSGSAS